MTRRATDSETAPATRSKERSNKALDDFLDAKAEMDAMLERLAALSADHFETSPDEINWGHVGTLNHDRASCARSATWPSGKANTPSETTRPRSRPPTGGLDLVEGPAPRAPRDGRRR